MGRGFKPDVGAITKKCFSFRKRLERWIFYFRATSRLTPQYKERKMEINDLADSNFLTTNRIRRAILLKYCKLSS